MHMATVLLFGQKFFLPIPRLFNLKCLFLSVSLPSQLRLSSGSMRGVGDLRYNPCVHLICVCLADIRSHTKPGVDLLIQFIPLSDVVSSLSLPPPLWLSRSSVGGAVISIPQLLWTCYSYKRGAGWVHSPVLHIRRGSERGLTILSKPLHKMC